MKGFVRLIILIFVVLATGYLLNISPGLDFIKDSQDDLSSIYKKFARNSCDQPLEYKLGNIDERFGLSNEDIILITKEAENLWEKAVGKDLFLYNQNSKEAVTINFIFDERQAQIFSSKVSEKNLEEKWSSYDELAKVYDSLSESYDLTLSEYNNNVLVYEQRLKEFNDKVDSWNRDPGSSNEFEELKETERQIKNLYNLLESERNSLSSTAEKINNLGDDLNNIFDQLDQETDLHNKKFDTGEVVDAGDYGQYEINIYQFYTRPDLKLTLAHEMGHSLGVDHLEDPESIMYFLLNEQDLINLKPSSEDVEAVLDLCGE